MNLFEKLGQLAANNIIKAAEELQGAPASKPSIFSNMFKSKPALQAQTPKPLSPAEDYAKYQNQRMESSRAQLPYNYMEGVKKDFNNKEKLKMEQEMKPTMFQRLGEGISNIAPTPVKRSPIEQLLFHSAASGRNGINFK